MEFSDYSGSIIVAVYDNVAEKMFKMCAIAMKELKDNKDEYDLAIDRLTYEPFLIGVEIKSERFILRTVEELKE